MSKRFQKGDVERWQRRLERRELGEDPKNHKTWVLDNLWRSASYEMTHREWEATMARKPPE
jgi:hypothetical protein